ncbi:MAG TPA: hypothetical protein GX696_05490, partial [Pseudomonadaceae bacterium]|nr:hypothetical protein [Pseudomonadaceae bacterium]
MSRPTIYVLAGVNGAGKSSVGSRALAQAGLSWFNPDTYARDLAKQLSIERNEANGLAWQEGFRQLNEAIANQQSYAFETTLGGNSIAA